MRLYTNEAMTENLDFYARAGYREIGRGEQDGFRRVFFVKELPAADVGQRPPAVAGDGPVDPSRDAVAQTLVQALSDIDAIASLWVTGSLAQGRGDRFSDLDLVALGAPGQVFPRGAVRAALTASLAPVLVDERDFGASVLFSLVTPDWIRVDLDLFRADATPWRTAESVRPLLQRGPASPAWAPAAAAASNENDRATGEAIIGPVREIVRVLGLLPVVLGRGHLVTGFAGCGLLATHLLTLAGRLAELAGAEAKPAGAMAAEGRRPAAYRDILGELPAAALRAESIREFHVSAWRALGELLAAAGRDLPVELEPAACPLPPLRRRRRPAAAAAGPPGYSPGSGLTARTGTLASRMIRWTFAPRTILPIGERERTPTTISSAPSSPASSTSSSAVFGSSPVRANQRSDPAPDGAVGAIERSAAPERASRSKTSTSRPSVAASRRP